MFSLVFQHNPLDGHADEVIKLKLEPLEIVFGHAIIAEAGLFFTPKKSKNLSDLTAVAESGFAKMTSSSRAGLQHAISKRKILDLAIDIDAPLIIVPQNSLREDTFLVVADLGRLLVSSIPVSKEKQEEVLRLQGNKMSAQEFASLPSLSPFFLFSLSNSKPFWQEKEL